MLNIRRQGVITSRQRDRGVVTKGHIMAGGNARDMVVLGHVIGTRKCPRYGGTRSRHGQEDMT